MRRHWEASSPEKVSGRRAGAFFRVDTEVPRILDTPPASINDRRAFIRDRIRKSDQQDWKFRHSISDRARWIWMGTYVLFMWGCIWTLRQNILVERPTGPELAWRAGLALAAATVPLSVAQAVGHCRYFVRPAQQAQVVRIVFMVPIYSVAFFLGLRFPHWRLRITAAREVYEAYAIYCFLHYLIGFLGGPAALAPRLAAKPAAAARHRPPYCCLPPWAPGRPFLARARAGVFQYLLWRIFCGCATIFLEHLGLFGEGILSPFRGYFWLTLGNCISQSFALYSLVLFYHVCQKDLAPAQPFLKFVCIKAIVFVTWWQGLAVDIVLRRLFWGTLDMPSMIEMSRVIQGLLLCMEMLVAALGFSRAFPVEEYYPEDPSLLTVSLIHHTKDEEILQPSGLGAALRRSALPSEALEDFEGALAALRRALAAAAAAAAPPAKGGRRPDKAAAAGEARLHHGHHGGASGGSAGPTPGGGGGSGGGGGPPGGAAEQQAAGGGGGAAGGGAPDAGGGGSRGGGHLPPRSWAAAGAAEAARCCGLWSGPRRGPLKDKRMYTL